MRAALLAWLAATGCAPPSFELASEPERALAPEPRPAGPSAHPARALPLPGIAVSQARKANGGGHDEAVAGWGRVAIHDAAATRGYRRLVLDLEQGSLVSVEYELPISLALPVAVGARVHLSYLPPAPLRTPARHGWVLTLKDEHEALLAALVVGRDRPALAKGYGLPKQPVPGLRAKVAEDGGYIEVRRTGTLCTSVVEHRPLEVTLERGEAVPSGKPKDDKILVSAGTYADLSAWGGAYRFVAFDAAVATAATCDGMARDQLAYAILALALKRPDATSDAGGRP